MYWKGKRVLVTGGAGVIGRELIDELVKLQSQILCIDREPMPEHMSRNVEYCRQDISEMNNKVITEFAPETIFHLAASFERVEETPEFWDINFRDNIIASHKIIDATRKLNSLEKFIFASSYLVYSPSQYLFDVPKTSPRQLKEEDLVGTRNMTGAAKYYIEKELEFMNVTHGEFITVSARIYRVYGCGSKDVISRWVRMALNGDELLVFKKENMFDYIFAGDVALGLVKMAEKVNNSEIINLGSKKSHRIEDVINVLKKYIPGVKVKEIKADGLFEASCADMSKFIRLTGWQPYTVLEEGIKKVVNYEKNI